MAGLLTGLGTLDDGVYFFAFWAHQILLKIFYLLEKSYIHIILLCGYIRATSHCKQNVGI
jgi:hypothetical protein